MSRALGRTWVLLVLALAGCATLRHHPPPLAAGVTAEHLLDGLAARRAATTTLRARARLKAGLAGLWTRQAVLVQRPGEVRMDVMSPFGLALAVGTQHDMLWAYQPSQQVRYEGEASPLNLARFLGAPVSVGDLVDILLGVPPVRVATGPPVLSRGAEGVLAGDGAVRRRHAGPVLRSSHARPAVRGGTPRGRPRAHGHLHGLPGWVPARPRRLGPRRRLVRAAGVRCRRAQRGARRDRCSRRRPRRGCCRSRPPPPGDAAPRRPRPAHGLPHRCRRGARRRRGHPSRSTAATSSGWSASRDAARA